MQTALQSVGGWGCGDLALLPPLVPVHDRAGAPWAGDRRAPQSSAAGHSSGEMWAVPCEGTVNAVRIGNALCYDDTGQRGNNKRGARRAGGYMGCHTFAFKSMYCRSVAGGGGSGGGGQFLVHNHVLWLLVLGFRCDGVREA